MNWPTALLGVSLMCAAPAALAQAPLLARSLAATCANCHGTDGRAQPGSAMEPLAGADAADLRRKLTEYKSGVRPATIMHQIAKGYTDEQIELLAVYFSRLKK
jgi:cytochrome c553